MQQDSEDPTELEALLEIIQKDLKALKAGDHAARTRLVDRSAQLQRAVETPAERTFKMRFAAGFSMDLVLNLTSLSHHGFLLWGKTYMDFIFNSSSNNSQSASSLRMARLQLYVPKEIRELRLKSCRRLPVGISS